LSQITKEIVIIGKPIADFDFSSTNNFSPPSSVTFVDKSKNSATYLWSFGDGSTSIEKDPIHTYLNSGSYIVELRAIIFSIENAKSKTVTVSKTDSQIDKLSKPWNINSATLDGVDKKSDYSNFTITLQGTQGTTMMGYTTIGRPALSPWASSGSFVFDMASPETKLIRDDAVVVTYSVSEASLQVSFQYSGAGFSRTSAIKGQWVFTFSQ
jgi:PKD repeat protein